MVIRRTCIVVVVVVVAVVVRADETTDFLYRHFDTKWLRPAGRLRVISLDSN